MGSRVRGFEGVGFLEVSGNSAAPGTLGMYGGHDGFKV